MDNSLAPTRRSSSCVGGINKAVSNHGTLSSMLFNSIIESKLLNESIEIFYAIRFSIVDFSYHPLKKTCWAWDGKINGSSWFAMM